jgi:hypothetical protein
MLNSDKLNLKFKQVIQHLNIAEGEKEKVNKQKVMTENLFNGFKKKYDEEIENAQRI